LALVLVALAAEPALAHVGPSPQTNNRYLTLVPEPGAVRLVYTLIFGDSPGAAARRRMDRDGDGRLSADEQRAFADAIADVIAAGLEIELDGERVDLAWSRVDLGISTTEVEAGAFSVDLSAVLCAESAGEHVLRLIDGFRVPPVGEGALSVEPSREVEILRSAMGAREGRRLAFKWMGRGPIADDGYALVFRAQDGAKPPRECEESPPAELEAPEESREVAPARLVEDAEELAPEGGGGPGRGALAGAALAVALAVLFAVGLFRRRR
jgi:hypothetical protein